MEEKFLPLGSVVQLKNGKKKTMITGFCMFDNNNNHKLYDYCGCPYPEGMLSTKEVHLFNHDQISNICYLGTSDEDDKKFKINLTSMIQIIEQTKEEEKEDYNADVVYIED